MAQAHTQHRHENGCVASVRINLEASLWTSALGLQAPPLQGQVVPKAGLGPT